MLDVFGGYEVDFTECAGIIEDEDSIVGEAAPEACCVRAEAVVREDIQVTGHTEVDVEMLLRRENDEDVFGTATDVEDGCAVENFKIARMVGKNSTGALDFDRVDLGVDCGFAEAADYCVYFWEFRHCLFS